MDRGTWRATVHGVAESETTEHARRCRYMQGFLGGLACSVSESVKCAFPILMKFKKVSPNVRESHSWVSNHQAWNHFQGPSEAGCWRSKEQASLPSKE